MKYRPQAAVQGAIAERSQRDIDAVNKWEEEMQGVQVSVKIIQSGQPRPYADSLYEGLIFCYQPNALTTNAPLPRVISEEYAKTIARLFIHGFDDEPKDWSSPKLEYCRMEDNPCGLDDASHRKQGRSSCWRVLIRCEYTG